MRSSTFAFFDVDDTLIRTKSMFSFFRFWCEEWASDPALLARFDEHFEVARSEGATREELNRDYYRFLAGTTPEELLEAGEHWAHGVIEKDLFYPATVAQLRERIRYGTLPVFVSGSFPEVLEPIAFHLGVSHVLATRMKLGSENTYTGEIDTPQTIGAGKAVAIGAFLAKQDCAASECWAFGDDISDLPMLECIGHPVAVGSNSGLIEVARMRDWTIIDAHS